MSAQVNYDLPEEIRDTEKCVFKMSFGEDKKKYFIFKTAKLRVIVQSLAEQIYREQNNIKEDSLLYKVVAYWKKHRPAQFYVTLLSPKAIKTVDLLLLENKLLKGAKNDPNCLNIEFDNTKKLPRWVNIADQKEFLHRLKFKNPNDRETRTAKYLSKFVSNEADVKKIMLYIKRNFA